MALFNRKEKVKIICAVCEKPFFVLPSRKDKYKTCSRSCGAKLASRKRVYTQASWNKGIPATEEHKEKLRQAKLKNPVRYWLGKERLDMKGDKNHRWNGGSTEINRKIRGSLEYKIWRRSVFERDKYECIWCGNKKSGSLQADHIKPFAQYPELRFAIDNGRTLCKPCHETTETYPRNLRPKR